MNKEKLQENIWVLLYAYYRLGDNANCVLRNDFFDWALAQELPTEANRSFTRWMIDLSAPKRQQKAFNEAFENVITEFEKTRNRKPGPYLILLPKE